MREKDTSMKSLATRREVKRRMGIANRLNIMTTSAKREAIRRDHIIMTMPVSLS
jgi:hypothetical protein